MFNDFENFISKLCFLHLYACKVLGKCIVKEAFNVVFQPGQAQMIQNQPQEQSEVQYPVSTMIYIYSKCCCPCNFCMYSIHKHVVLVWRKVQIPNVMTSLLEIAKHNMVKWVQ